MDGISDGSPWSIFIHFIDRTDQVWHDHFDSLLILCTTSFIYTLSGSRRDLLLNVAFLGWANRRALIDVPREASNVILLALTSLIITVVAGAALLSSLNTNELQWKGPGRA